MEDIRFAEPARLVDYGNAPEIYADGLARVDRLSTVTLLALFRFKTIIIDGRSEQIREVTQNVILPTAAVGPAVELTLTTFGTGLLIPAASHATRRLLS
jgi:hypothetical protein